MVESHSDRTFKTISHLVMILLSLLAVLPMVLLLTSSLTANQSLIADGYSFFPKQWSLESYAYILNNSLKIFRAYGVSIIDVYKRQGGYGPDGHHCTGDTCGCYIH